MKTKAVNYAYPGSTAAGRAGFGLSGCWVVQTIEGAGTPERKPPVLEAGFATQAEAEAHAETLDLPWDRFTYRLAAKEAQ